MTENTRPHTEFAWPMYTDATLAGLSVLIPLPIIDSLLERHFMRRMPAAIARYRNHALPPATRRVLNASRRGWFAAGAVLILKLPLELIKRLSRKILYVLTIKEAADQLSYYWQRAFLLDYMLSSGHLATVESARAARDAMEQAIKSSPSPLRTLSRQIVRSLGSVLAVLRYARRQRQNNENGKDTLSALPALPQTLPQQQWHEYQAFFQTLATTYAKLYQQRIEQQQIDQQPD